MPLINLGSTSDAWWPRCYFDTKKKIESKTLGATIPDGFFFDFSDPTDPQFYIVEVELSKHGFYDHIFPQITRFFALFNNTALRKSLVDKLFSIIDSDPQLKPEFRKISEMPRSKSS